MRAFAAKSNLDHFVGRRLGGGANPGGDVHLSCDARL
jgi:hypothetical protein